MDEASPRSCGGCRWHFAHEEAVERVGWKNCLGLPYPDCTEFYSKPEARCSFPVLFQPLLPPITGALHIKL
jgi:hypothetical protein